MNSLLLKQSVRDVKSKIHSTIGTFGVIALLYIIVSVPLMLFTGIRGTNYWSPSPGTKIEQFGFLNSSFFSLANIIIFPTLIMAAVFFVIYGIRNNYATCLPFAATRDSYMLSDITTGIVYSGLIALLSTASDCIVRIVIGNASNNYVFAAEETLALQTVGKSFLSIFGICLALFVGLMAIINNISRKKYPLILANLGITIVFVFLFFIPDLLFAVKFTDKQLASIYAYFHARASTVGILVISIAYSATLWGINYLFLRREGGFRR